MLKIAKILFSLLCFVAAASNASEVASSENIKTNPAAINLSASVIEDLTHVFKGGPEKWEFYAIRPDSNPWIRSGKLYAMDNPDLFETVYAVATIYVPSQGDAVVLNDTDGPRQAAIDLINKYAPFNSWKDHPIEFANGVLGALNGTLAALGSEAFLKRVQPDFSGWLYESKITKEDFKKYCKGPEFKMRGDGWRLQFYLFTSLGEIVEFTLSGKNRPFSASTVTRKVIYGPKSFAYLLEGA